MLLQNTIFSPAIVFVARFCHATSPGIHLTSYAPVHVACPSTVQWIRPANGLNPSEAEYVRLRKPVVLQEFADYLERLGLEEFDLSLYLSAINDSKYDNVPNIGLAVSGGGYASCYTGSGALTALDARLPAALEARTGGLLQSLMYQTGLSGASWLTMSFLAHDWPTAYEIVDYWHPELGRPTLGNSTEFTPNLTTVFELISEKFKAGFPVTIADYLGIAASYEFIGGPLGGLGVTLSNLVNIPSFINHQAPFPILHLSSILPNDAEFFGAQIPFENATTYELTPYEFGAWEGDFSSFTPTEWLGTHIKNGSPINKSACVQGFDRVGFMMGSSSGAANMWWMENLSNGTLGTFGKRSHISSELPKSSYQKRQNNAVPQALIDRLLDEYDKLFHENFTEAIYSTWANPFAGLETTTPLLRNLSDLKIVDGSEAGQANPLWSQIQPVRHPDFIITWDDDEDARPYSWNNGTNVYNTYVAANRSGIPFPIVPTAPTFIANNYTFKPVFFGCDPLLTTTASADAPILLYLANAPYSAYTNYSFAQDMTSREQMNEIFTNSFDLVTQGNGTLDAEWPQCLGCAAIDRSKARVGMQRTKQCQRCMERYCWDGVSVPDVLAGPEGGRYEVTEIVDLEMVLNPGVSFAEWNATHPF